MSKEILPPGSENLDEFSILNYRSKYRNLLAGKKHLSQLDFTLNNISDGIISLNTEWRITYVYGNAAEILDRTATNLIGKHFWTEFPDVSLNISYDGP
ncbi:PAS domain-containing protein [Muricauda brasiliensis]|uniref:PAS domain-containing protein n=1 Tax=Muricauda brasiliensis TaxID=2162892 RepID=UPI000D3C0988|nr:PAS domain-containing protein [Muricauda brasiliensis]